MKRTTISLSDEEHTKVSAAAAKAEMTFNDLLRQIVREWEPPKAKAP